MDGFNAQFMDAVKYLVSPERGKLLPKKIDCSNQNDYARIEKILKNEFGGDLAKSFKRGQMRFCWN